MLTTEYFDTDTVPTDSCDHHVALEICADSGAIAGPYCPNKTSKVFITGAVSGSPEYEFMADDTFMNTVCTLHDATSLINSSPTTTDPTNPVLHRAVLTALRLEHRQVGLELVPLPAQVLVLVALEPVLPVPVAPVQVVLIPAAPVHPVTLIVNHYDLQLNYLKQNPQGSYPRGFLLMYIC